MLRSSIEYEVSTTSSPCGNRKGEKCSNRKLGCHDNCFDYGLYLARKKKADTKRYDAICKANEVNNFHITSVCKSQGKKAKRQ